MQQCIHSLTEKPEHFVPVGRHRWWDSIWNSTMRFPFPDLHCSGFLWNGRSYSRAEVCINTFMLCNDNGVKESSFFSEIHGMNFDSCFFMDCELLLERVCSLQSETLYEMEETVQSKMAMLHCSENSHYNFMFGKWNCSEYPFYEKTADWDWGVIQIGDVRELLQK